MITGRWEQNRNNITSTSNMNNNSSKNIGNHPYHGERVSDGRAPMADLALAPTTPRTHPC